MAEGCVDASFALKVILPELRSDVVRAAWASWLAGGVSVVAPWLFLFEAHFVLRRKVVRQELTDLEARDAWRVLRRQGICTVHPRGLFDRAWALAAELARPATYDAVYMAAAELELWTADERLANASRGKFAWIHLVSREVPHVRMSSIIAKEPRPRCDWWYPRPRTGEPKF